MIVLLALGLICVVLGIWALSCDTKYLPRAIRAACVALPCVGLGILWGTGASNYPVLLDREVHIKSMDTLHVSVSLVVEKIRDCDLESLDVFAVTPNGSVSKASWSTPPVPPEDSFSGKIANLSDLQNIFIKLPSYPVSKIYFQSLHSCPYGFEVKTKFGQINLDN